MQVDLFFEHPETKVGLAMRGLVVPGGKLSAVREDARRYAANLLRVPESEIREITAAEYEAEYEYGEEVVR